MNNKNFVKEKVKNSYWVDDINCTIIIINILSEEFKITIDKQVIDSAIAIHGAGEYERKSLWLLCSVLKPFRRDYKAVK